MTAGTTTEKQQDSIPNKLKAYHKANPWKSRFFLILLSLVILVTIARIALTPVVIYGATNWLKDQGIDSTIEDIEINFINGNISLIDASGYHDDKLLFNIDLVELHWHWAPLSEKTVVVTKVELDNLNVNIDQYSDEIIIGGLSIPQNSTTEPVQEEPENEADEEINPWSASLGEAVFTNLHVCYMQDTGTHAAATDETRFIDYCVYLDEMTWGGTISYGTDPELLKSDDLPLASTGDFEIDGLTVMDNKLNKQLLRSSSNILSDVSISGLNDIKIETIHMNGLSALQREDEEHQDAVRFRHLEVNDINFRNLNSLSIESLMLDDTGLYIVKLDQDDWEYAQWIPQSPDTTAPKAKDENQSAEPAQFEFSINNILISDSDFCYLETENKLYYCFNQNTLEWNGPIKTASKADDTKISITGNLAANDTKIHNPGLNRNLVDIETIALNKLNITDVNKISFENFTIENLSALQRGEKPDDSTAAFSTLMIEKVAYTGDAVSINKIKLDDLSSHITKNKDGSWDFDKWLTDTKPNSEEKTNAEKGTVKTTEKKPITEKQPFLISIKSTEIRTDKELLYIDNSTQPTMTVGLNKFEFKLDDLDANKPNADSKFKLSAKTKRHGTIDMAGTARPFADKVSFDGKGKLKGFDLRAGSPAAKQAIGHIIKSGQMDADLTLLAKDGILDSNIALSLYHFNIKAESKEDAEKLDKEFGMPLNQTLVLLRDKDDSIHLDIPITGDVNNPEFNPMDAIIKATSKAATVTLITFYTPYGLVYAGGNVLFDLATAMNFDPIEFQPGKSILSTDNKEKLKSLSKLLAEKPQVHLTLCGMTNTSDLHTLYPKLKGKAEDKNKELKLSKEQASALAKLAKERQTNSKNYLVEETKIEHSRLILCEPEHQTDEKAIAGVEINI